MSNVWNQILCSCLLGFSGEVIELLFCPSLVFLKTALIIPAASCAKSITFTHHIWSEIASIHLRSLYHVVCLRHHTSIEGQWHIKKGIASLPKCLVQRKGKSSLFLKHEATQWLMILGKPACSGIDCPHTALLPLSPNPLALLPVVVCHWQVAIHFCANSWLTARASLTYEY